MLPASDQMIYWEVLLVLRVVPAFKRKVFVPSFVEVLVPSVVEVLVVLLVCRAVRCGGLSGLIWCAVFGLTCCASRYN